KRERRAPRNEKKVMKENPWTLTVSPKRMAATAPKELPPATPSVKGQAKGLRSTAWKTTPAQAMAAPARAAKRFRGNLTLKKTWASWLSGAGGQVWKTFP